MSIHRIPQITKEEVAGIFRKAADHKKDPQTTMKLVNLEFHMLVIDKMGLDDERRNQLIALDSHRQRLSIALVSKLTPIPYPSMPTLTRPLAEGILKKHRELALADSLARADEAGARMKRIEHGEDPTKVLDEQFLSYALSVCTLITKRVLGHDGYVIYNDLHSQITRITSSDENILAFVRSMGQGQG